MAQCKDLRAVGVLVGVGVMVFYSHSLPQYHSIVVPELHHVNFYSYQSIIK